MLPHIYCYFNLHSLWFNKGLPSSSPFFKIFTAGRSFTDPPGFKNSHLPQMVQSVSLDADRSIMRGVDPTVSLNPRHDLRAGVRDVSGGGQLPRSVFTADPWRGLTATAAEATACRTAL